MEEAKRMGQEQIKRYKAIKEVVQKGNLYYKSIDKQREE